MNEMMATMMRLGMSPDECIDVCSRYKDDLDGLAIYVLYMRAVLDDAHEYI